MNANVNVKSNGQKIKWGEGRRKMFCFWKIYDDITQNTRTLEYNEMK